MWFSSEYGSFSDENDAKTYYETRVANLDPCNPQGEVQAIVLDDLGLTGLRPTIPPEIALLTSLSHLILRRNGIGVSLRELLPTELYRMPNLTLLALPNNHNISGTIPSKVGLLSKLEVLELDDNSISGTLPTEMGLLKNIQRLVLHRNKKIEGSIPSEFGAMSNLQDLSLNQNRLSGTIPTELGGLSSLQWLNLARTALEGTMPIELTSIDTLLDLKL